jgi:hypothetical protein
MEVRGERGMALSLPELLIALADPSARSGLVFDLAGSGADTEIRTVAVADVGHDFELSLARYLTLDKTLLILPELPEPQGLL